MKKDSKCFYLLFILLVGFITLTAQASAAEENLAQVSTQYRLFDELSSEEQAAVTKGEPSFKITNDFESMTLVYKKIDEQSVTNLKSNDGNTSSSKKLPATGEMKSHSLFIILGIAVFVSGASLAVVKRKQLKRLVFFMMIVGGVGNALVVDAQAVGLPKSSIEALPKNIIYNKQNNIEGYEYVGYIRTSSNNPQIENGMVLVKYQDANGNELISDNNLMGVVGLKYQAEQKMFEGYTLDRIEGNQAGIFSSETQVVKFIYSKNVETGKIILQQSGIIPSAEENEPPSYFVATYYDYDGNVLKTEELHGDIILQNQEITMNLGDSYLVYSYVIFQGYSEATKEQNYLKYMLFADETVPTKGFLTQKLLIINYKLYNSTPV